ncbi:membrane hypothetical protein [Candidatus Methylacidithermus pantelleriae]|uniref:Uncharacterized protein n=1 Tax=Candidatus Methylacidithermus pantelleriae TaxID=2744239 RepID=A0A8J2BL25_9BACT|nr:membrane hypothetical protein [Candidatus Methylacidithermus pantelleriae]
MVLTLADLIHHVFPWLAMMTLGVVVTFWILPPGPKRFWVLAAPFSGNRASNRTRIVAVLFLFLWITSIAGMPILWQEIGLATAGLLTGWVAKVCLSSAGQDQANESYSNLGAIKRTLLSPVAAFFWAPVALLWTERPMPTSWLWTMLGFLGAIHCASIQGFFWSRFIPPDTLNGSESILFDRLFAFACLKDTSAPQLPQKRLGVAESLRGIQTILLFTTSSFFFLSFYWNIPFSSRILISLAILAGAVFLWRYASQLLYQARCELQAAWLGPGASRKVILRTSRYWKLLFFISTLAIAAGQFHDFHYALFAFVVEALLLMQCASPCWEEAAELKRFYKLTRRPVFTTQQKRELIALINTMLLRPTPAEWSPPLHKPDDSILGSLKSKEVGSQKNALLPMPSGNNDKKDENTTQADEP